MPTQKKRTVEALAASVALGSLAEVHLNPKAVAQAAGIEGIAALAINHL